DEAHAGRRVPRLRNPRVDLVPGQLAALAGLGALRHLDLQLVGVDEVLAGDAEAARGHLLDGAALRVAVGHRQEPLGVLAALAGVRLAAQAVHGNRQRLVRLAADRAVGHRARGEALDDLLHRLYLVERHRRRVRLEAEQPAQRRAVLVLHVDRLRVLLEDLVLAGAGRVLQLVHRLRVEEVVLTVAAPLVFAARLELLRLRRLAAERAVVAQLHFLGNHLDADAAY